MLLAQGVFVLYLLGSYGRSTLRGDVAAWSKFSAKGWIPGDIAGNTAMAVHVSLAVLVLLAGAIQVIPALRRRAPRLHRWSGRVYLSGCLISAVTGLSLVWGRGTVGDLSQHVAISINAVLVAGCASMAWRTARARDFAAHRTWAMRTFVTAGGVLYFRLLLALWLVIFRGPVGFDARTFSGPFLTTLAFTVYVFGPLMVYETYRVALNDTRRLTGAGATVLMSVVTLAMVAGSGAALLVLWLPRLGGG